MNAEYNTGLVKFSRENQAQVEIISSRYSVGPIEQHAANCFQQTLALMDEKTDILI